MAVLSKLKIVQATMKTPWDFGNDALYRLCKSHPEHTEEDVIIAKIWLIGRSYAAAIERRQTVDARNEHFYLDVVAPIIMDSQIDEWIHNLKRFKRLSLNAFHVLIETHGNITSLFNEISDMNKRSLASKYLHFHVPHLVFLYDSRALRAISKLSAQNPKLVGRASNSQGVGDNEYRKFAEKCMNLRSYIEQTYDSKLTPRQIDNLLLSL